MRLRETGRKIAINLKATKSFPYYYMFAISCFKLSKSQQDVKIKGFLNQYEEENKHPFWEQVDSRKE